MSQNSTSKMLIIDTEQYSGNFEREMCAFITGQIGECGVGRELADKYSHEIKHLDWWEENISQQPDNSESECMRPVSIVPTPGWLNNGTGRHYRVNPDKPSSKGYPAYLSVAVFVENYPPAEVWKEFVERAHYFAENYATITQRNYLNENKIKVTGFRQISPTPKKRKGKSVVTI